MVYRSANGVFLQCDTIGDAKRVSGSRSLRWSFSGTWFPVEQWFASSASQGAVQATVRSVTKQEQQLTSIGHNPEKAAVMFRIATTGRQLMPGQVVW